MQQFHGRFTKQVAGMPGISRTFAVDVMCHPLLLELLRPHPGAVVRALSAQPRATSCNAARAATSSGCTATRRCGATSRGPHPELQLATVIAFVDFTRENGATRVVPGSHRWPDRQMLPAEQVMQEPPGPDQIAYAEMPAGSAVVYTGGTIHAGGANRTDVPRRGAHIELLPRLVAHRGEQLPLDAARRSRRRLPRQAQELSGYAVHDSIPRGGGYLGMVRMQDPVELLARGEL